MGINFKWSNLTPKTDTKIEDNSRAFKLQKANFDKEVNTAKAEAQLAYELQAAKIQQKIRNEEIQIQVQNFSRCALIESYLQLEINIVIANWNAVLLIRWLAAKKLLATVTSFYALCSGNFVRIF